MTRALIVILQIGACRHGDRCSRKHIKPPFSQTILLPNVYHNPANDPSCKLSEKELQDGFDAVYEDLYWYVPFQLRDYVYLLSLVSELTKFGHLLELHVRVPSFVCHSSSRVTCRSVIMLETILLETYTLVMNGRRKLRLQSIT